jgi:hypothetical protein
VQQVVGSTLALDPAPPGGWGKSAASWPAIFAGAAVAVAASLLLLTLGAGFGLALVSAWPGHGVSAKGFTINAAIWVIVTQWVSAALGGYLAGRLRTKWVGTHTHEVFFRDTAHGLVTWAVATVVAAAVLAGSVSSIVGEGLHAVGGAAAAGVHGAAGGAAQGAMAPPGMSGGGPSPAMTYDIDKLFRAPAGRPSAGGPGTSGAAPGGASDAGSPGMDTSSDPRIEAVYIAFHAMAGGSVSDEDRAYLAQLVQAQTGLTPAEAQKRVDDFITATLNAENKARAAADAARKAAAQTSIYTALAMLIGAFIASVSAAIGGRLRDEHP